MQACYVGQIRISRAGAIGQLTMDVGAIGGVGAALVELGSINNLTVEYGATSDPYVSIHLNVADNAFMISSDNSFVPIRNTAALKQTTTSAPLFPNKGSVYLVRMPRAHAGLASRHLVPRPAGPPDRKPQHRRKVCQQHVARQDPHC